MMTTRMKLLPLFKEGLSFMVLIQRYSLMSIWKRADKMRTYMSLSVISNLQ